MTQLMFNGGGMTMHVVKPMVINGIDAVITEVGNLITEDEE